MYLEVIAHCMCMTHIPGIWIAYDIVLMLVYADKFTIRILGNKRRIKSYTYVFLDNFVQENNIFIIFRWIKNTGNLLDLSRAVYLVRPTL